MNFGRIFQYLFIYKNEIYQDHIIYRPDLYHLILWLLRIKTRPYSREQIEEAEKMVLDGAVRSIDKLLEAKIKNK